jgi:hypothetical protein
MENKIILILVIIMFAAILIVGCRNIDSKPNDFKEIESETLNNMHEAENTEKESKEEQRTEDIFSESKEYVNEIVENASDATSDNSFMTETIEQETIIYEQTAVNAIHIQLKDYSIPECIPQGDLNDNQYAVLNEILDVLKHSNQSEEQVPTLLYGSIEDAWLLLDIIKNYIGVDVSCSRISRCDEAGNTRNFESHDYTQIVIQPIKTRENMEKKIHSYNVTLEAVKKAGLYDGMSETQAVRNITLWIVDHMTYVINNGNAYV